MNKPIFYCDCDGVLLNTIEVAFNIMRNNGCDMSDRNAIDYYFRHIIDWDEIFDKASIINNSLSKLQIIKESGFFQDVVILTKLSGSDKEERLKRDFFKEKLPDIKVVTLQYGLSKGLVVPARGNVLVDDEVGNCIKWKNENGIAILYAQYMRNPEDDVINDLSDLTNTSGIKKLLKTRNF